MEDGFTITESLQFDIPISSVQGEEDEEDAAEALMREKQIQEDLQHGFDDLVDDDCTSSSDESDSRISHKDSERHNHSVDASFEHSNLSPRYSQMNGNDYSSSHSTDHTQAQEVSKMYSASVTEDKYENFNYKQERYKYHSENESIIPETRFKYVENHQPNSITTSSHFNEDNADLQAKYLKLQILYETTLQELEQVKKRESKTDENANQEIRTLHMQVILLQGDKERLQSSLQESQELVSDFRNQNSVLQGQLSALQIQLSSITNEKKEAISKLGSAEVTIQALEKKINELNRSDTLSRLRSQTDSIIEDLKLRHQNELLHYKEVVDKLQSELYDKKQNNENLEYKVSHLQQKCEQLQIEKSELFNKLSSQLEASQRQCQQLLQSDSISEVGILKLKIQQLEEEKTKFQKESISLKEEIKSLEAELRTSEAVQKITTSNLNYTKQNEFSQNKNKQENLQSELEKSLKNLRSQRSLNSSLRKQVEEMKEKLPFWQEKANLFESRYNESEKKTRDLEEKLNSYRTTETVPLSLHENKVKDLESKLNEIQIKLHDVTEKFKQASINEKNLREACDRFQKKITEMVQQHAQEKMQAIEECREKCLEIHESAVQTLKQSLLSKADTELKSACANYENKISALQRELKLLNEGLYDSKTQYINIFEENKSLQKKVEEISKPKEREEIEAEVKAEYEKKLDQVKEFLQQENSKILESCLKNKIENVQKEWAKQKMTEVKDFIDETKEHLDKEFQACLQKERNSLMQQLESEKEKFENAYQKSISELKNKYEEEKLILGAKLNQHYLNKWEEQANILKMQNKQEIEQIKNQYNDKVKEIEKELEKLKNQIPFGEDEQEKFLKLKEDFLSQQDVWKKEREEYVTTISCLKTAIEASTKTEDTLQGKLKKYQKHVAALEKHYKGKVTKLQKQISDLQISQQEKQDQLLSAQKLYEQQMIRTGDMLRNMQKSTKHSGSQTLEEVVSKQKIEILRNLFLDCMKAISEEVKNFLEDSAKRHTEHHREAIINYHQHLSSKLFQDISKDIHSFSPNIIIPQTMVKSAVTTSAEETFDMPNGTRNFCSTKIKTSTPAYQDGQYMQKKKDTFMKNRFKPNMGLFTTNISEPPLRFEDISFNFYPQSAFDSDKLLFESDFTQQFNNFQKNPGAS